MSTLAINQDIKKDNHLLKDLAKFVKSFFKTLEVIKRDTRTETKENLLPKTYNVMISENHWVKNVFRYINSEELWELLPSGKRDFSYIEKKIEKEGICRINIRKGLFKRIEFHITGFWDY